jgi:hypothetical protein
MKTATLTTIRSILYADGSLAPEEVDAAVNRMTKPIPSKRKQVTVKRAAEILQVHPKTVQRYAAEGKLSRIVHSPRKIRYDLEEVERFAAEGINA